MTVLAVPPALVFNTEQVAPASVRKLITWLPLSLFQGAPLEELSIGWVTSVGPCGLLSPPLRLLPSPTPGEQASARFSQHPWAIIPPGPFS